MRIVAWSLAAGPALWALLRLGGLDRFHPLVAMVSFTPYAVAASVLVVLLLAVLKQWRPLLLAAVATLALGAVVLGRGVGGSGDGGTGRPLRVLSVNVTFGSVSVDALMDVVRERDVDVLSVQELTPEFDARLRRAGIDGTLPQSVTRPEGGATGTGIYARLPLRELPPPEGGPFAQTAAHLDFNGGVEVVSVHPPPPVSAQHVESWHETFDGLPHGDRPRILAGDFNATLDHRAMRELVGSGYTDVADATGEGLRATWPAGRLLPPGIVIDHVLVTRELVPVRTDVIELPGGDHRAVLSEVVARASTR